MVRRKKRRTVLPRSKKVVKEASDIILNTEDDKDAVHYLRETLTDDFPEIDISKMSLHEASEVLNDGQTKKSGGKVTQDLISELNDFVMKSAIEREKKARKESKRKKTFKKKK